jgi:hypothetical protein
MIKFFIKINAGTSGGAIDSLVLYSINEFYTLRIQKVPGMVLL